MPNGLTATLGCMKDAFLPRERPFLLIFALVRLQICDNWAKWKSCAVYLFGPDAQSASLTFHKRARARANINNLNFFLSTPRPHLADRNEPSHCALFLDTGDTAMSTTTPLIIDSILNHPEYLRARDDKKKTAHIRLSYQLLARRCARAPPNHQSIVGLKSRLSPICFLRARRSVGRFMYFDRVRSHG